MSLGDFMGNLIGSLTAAGTASQQQQTQVQIDAQAQQMQQQYNALAANTAYTQTYNTGMLGNSFTTISNSGLTSGNIQFYPRPGQVINTTTAPSVTFLNPISLNPITYQGTYPPPTLQPELSEKEKRILARLNRLEALWETAKRMKSGTGDYTWNEQTKVQEIQLLAILEMTEDILAKKNAPELADPITALMQEVYAA